jgi:hypothetical protein
LAGEKGRRSFETASFLNVFILIRQCFYGPKDPTPINPFRRAVFSKRPPYEQRLTHHMILGHEAPDTGIFRIVSIISHHPVVVHFEGIFASFFTIDIKLTIGFPKIIVFVNVYDPPEKGDVVFRQLDGSSFLGYPMGP